VSVSSIYGYSSSQANDTMPATDKARSNSMGQDAFMKLLTTQLQNQDPLKPQENGEFLAQLAQFSSLEKLTSIESSIKDLAAAFAALTGDTTSTGGSDTSSNTGQ